MSDAKKKLATATLTSVFGVGPVVAATVIGEVRVVSRFPGPQPPLGVTWRPRSGRRIPGGLRQRPPVLAPKIPVFCRASSWPVVYGGHRFVIMLDRRGGMSASSSRRRGRWTNVGDSRTW
jgi:hypothetical protein